MRRCNWQVVYAATLMLIYPIAAVDAQENNWRAAGGGNRYGAAGGAASNADAGSARRVDPFGESSTAANVGNAPQANSNQLTPIGAGVRRAPVRERSATLPNSHGQVMREYDISTYTLRTTTTSRPEQAIVDWILACRARRIS